MKFVVTIVVAMMVMVSFGTPFVGGKDVNAPVGVTAATTKQPPPPPQQQPPEEERFHILIVCQKDHEDECKNEIESVEGVRIVNHMIYTPNMFVMEVCDDDDNEPVDEEAKMAELQALPHVKEVEEDRIINFHHQDPTATHTKVDKLEQMLQQDPDVLDSATDFNHHTLSTKFKEAFRTQRGADDIGNSSRRRGLRHVNSKNKKNHQKQKLEEQPQERKRMLSHLGQEIPYGIYQTNAPQMWEEYGTKGAGVKVCVLDSGVSNTHEDFDPTRLSGTGGTTVLPNNWVRRKRSLYPIRFFLAVLVSYVRPPGSLINFFRSVLVVVVVCRQYWSWYTRCWNDCGC